MSASIDGKTPVVLAMRQALGAAATILVVGIGAFWALASWTSADLRDNVSEIRKTLEAVQGAGNALNIKQTEVDFTKQVGALDVTLANFGGRMEVFGTKVDAMSRSMDQFQSQMAEMQKEPAVSRPRRLDVKSLAETLAKVGVNGKNIIIIPYLPTALEPPKD